MEEYATQIHETKNIVPVFRISKDIQENADKLHKKMCRESARIRQRVPLF